MRGENITHNFQEMIPLGTLIFGPENTSANATTDDVTYTYTCGEDAKFDVVSTVVGIKMYENGDYVIVTPAIGGLNRLMIGYNANSTTTDSAATDARRTQHVVKRIKTKKN